MLLKSGHKVSHITGKELDGFFEGFRSREGGLIRLNPGGWIYNTEFLNSADNIYEFKLRPDDVIVLTYAKSGTTWMQEIVWTLKNNLDFNHPEAKESIHLRSISFEGDNLNIPNLSKQPLEPHILKKFNDLCPDGKSMDFRIFDSYPDPRLIKSHKPLSLLPPDTLKTSKVIYVARNPMDVCLSYCHHFRMLKKFSYTGSFDRFLELFVRDRLNWSPYWTHLKEAWRNRNDPNLLFCFYEDMKENPRENLLRVAEFLDVKLCDDKIEKVLNYTSFNSMKERSVFFGVPDVQSPLAHREFCEKGGFFRKGESGSWKSELTFGQAERIKQWSLQHLKDFEESESFLSRWFSETTKKTDSTSSP